MTIVEIMKECVPYVLCILTMIGIWYGGMLVGEYRGRERTLKEQRIVFVVMHENGKVSAVTQEGKRFSFVTDCGTENMSDEERR